MERKIIKIVYGGGEVIERKFGVGDGIDKIDEVSLENEAGSFNGLFYIVWYKNGAIRKIFNAEIVEWVGVVYDNEYDVGGRKEITWRYAEGGDGLYEGVCEPFEGSKEGYLMGCVKNAARDVLYYNRKNDDELNEVQVNDLFQGGRVSREDVFRWFIQGFDEWVEVEKEYDVDEGWIGDYSEGVFNVGDRLLMGMNIGKCIDEKGLKFEFENGGQFYLSKDNGVFVKKGVGGVWEVQDLR